MYLMGVMDQANVAMHIREGKEAALLKNIEPSLPGYVMAIDHNLKSHKASTAALWMVKAYYERNNLDIPAEIRGILDSLPPKPPTACEIRLRALDAAATTD